MVDVGYFNCLLGGGMKNKGYLIILIVTAIIPFFQNCKNGSFQSQEILSSSINQPSQSSNEGSGSTPSTGGSVGGISDPLILPPTVNSNQFNKNLLGPQVLKDPTQCESLSGICYYSSPTGIGTICSSSQPCRVMDAIAKLKAGDTLYLKAGVYDNSWESKDRLNFNRSFPHVPTTSSSIIQIRGLRGAIIKGNKIDPCWLIDGQKYLNISGFIFEDCRESGITIGMDASDITHHITVSNNEFRNFINNDNMGAIFVNFVSDITFENNIVHDFERNGTKGGGLIIFRAVNLTVKNNEFYNLYEGLYYKHGERAWGNGGFTHIYGNYFHDIQQYIGTNQNRSEIFYNIFDNSKMPSNAYLFLFQADGTSGDFLFDVNIQYNTFIKFGLTLSDNDGGSQFSGSRRTVIKNNIFYNGSLSVWPYGLDADFDANSPQLVSDNNCFYMPNSQPEFLFFFGLENTKGGRYDFSNWNKMGYDLNSSSSNPYLDLQTYVVSDESPCLHYGAYSK